MLLISSFKKILLVVLSCLLCLQVSISNVAAQNCLEGFFQYGDGELKLLDPLTGTYDVIATGDLVNAIGYDQTSGYIYGLDVRERLVQISPVNGSIVTLGPVTNIANPAKTLSDMFVNSGDHNNIIL